MRSNPLAGELYGSSALLTWFTPPGLRAAVFEAPDEPEDEDTGDLQPGVNEDALDEDEVDTDRIADPDPL